MTTKTAENTPRALKPLRRTIKRARRVVGTYKQKLAIAKLVENGGVVSSAMIAAEYSPNTAHTPQKLTESKAYKQALPDIIEQMMIERNRAILQMKGKIGKAKYRDMVESVDKLTKNIQLLTGNSTIKGDITFSWDKD